MSLQNRGNKPLLLEYDGNVILVFRVIKLIAISIYQNTSMNRASNHAVMHMSYIYITCVVRKQGRIHHSISCVLVGKLTKSKGLWSNWLTDDRPTVTFRIACTLLKINNGTINF